jgi:hypothetical protein
MDVVQLAWNINSNVHFLDDKTFLAKLIKSICSQTKPNIALIADWNHIQSNLSDNVLCKHLHATFNRHGLNGFGSET